MNKYLLTFAGLCWAAGALAGGDECDLNHSIQVGNPDWIGTYVIDGVVPPIEEGIACEIRLQVVESPPGSQQRAFYFTEHPQNPSASNGLNFYILDPALMLGQFSHEQTMKFFSLHALMAGTTHNVDLFSLNLNLALNNDNTDLYWQIQPQAGMGVQIQMDSHRPFNIPADAPLIAVHVNWWMVGLNLCVVNLNVNGMEFEYRMQVQSAPRASALGYISAQPELKPDNQMRFMIPYDYAR